MSPPEASGKLKRPPDWGKERVMFAWAVNWEASWDNG